MPLRFAVLPLAALLLFALPAAAPAQMLAGPDDEARNMLRLLCVKHEIRPESACDALAGFVSAPPLLPAGEGALDALFDAEYESEQLRGLAEKLELPPAGLAGAVYDYRVWDLARQAAGRAPDTGQ